MLLSRGPGNPNYHLPPLSGGWGRVRLWFKSGCLSKSPEAPGRQSGTGSGRGEDAPYIFLTSFSLGGGWTDVTLGVLGRTPTRDLLPGILPEDS